MSFNRSLTKSQARSLLSIAKVKDDKVAPRSCDFQANANAPDVLRFERFVLADEQSLIPRSLVSTDRRYKHGGSSATPPSASLYRERIITTEQSGSPQTEFATDRFWRKTDVG
jgi:hypothetical protein